MLALPCDWSSSIPKRDAFSAPSSGDLVLEAEIEQHGHRGIFPCVGVAGARCGLQVLSRFMAAGCKGAVVVWAAIIDCRCDCGAEDGGLCFF